MIVIEVSYPKPSSGKPNIEKALLHWHAYMVRQTDDMFAHAGGPGSGKHGGEYRGVFWKPFSPQYTRQDGTVVPAWGGVEKVRGKGLVKPRTRPSGQPITPLSALVQDTGRLRQRAATEIVQVTPTSLVFGTQLEYAAYQNEIRPFLFATDEDVEYLTELIAEQLEEEL